MFNNGIARQGSVQSIEFRLLLPSSIIVREKIGRLVPTFSYQHIRALAIEADAEKTIRRGSIRGGEFRRFSIFTAPIIIIIVIISTITLLRTGSSSTLEDVHLIPPRRTHEQNTILQKYHILQMSPNLCSLRSVQPITLHEGTILTISLVHIHHASIRIFPFVRIGVRIVRCLDREVVIGYGDGVPVVSVEVIRLRSSGVVGG
mmetsp:Transcript_18749/g.33736  ORF Transcript_18749/g.33736 Transcript_18749/m.33736 type:complete len:203 (-) Transcript_18749:143-751(-)